MWGIMIDLIGCWWKMFGGEASLGGSRLSTEECLQRNRPFGSTTLRVWGCLGVEREVQEQKYASAFKTVANPGRRSM